MINEQDTNTFTPNFAEPVEKPPEAVVQSPTPQQPQPAATPQATPSQPAPSPTPVQATAHPATSSAPIFAPKKTEKPITTIEAAES